MGSCVSCCGGMVQAAEDGYGAIATGLPWLHLPNGQAPRGDGVLIVQVLRDPKLLPSAPICTLEDDKISAPLFNIAGRGADLPADAAARAKEKGSTGLAAPAPAAHSYFMLVLLKDRDIAHMTLAVDFGAVPGKQGPSAGLFKLKLTDGSVSISSSQATALSTTLDNTYKEQSLGGAAGPKFQLSVVRYNVLGNSRYPYTKSGLIEATRDSDFNAYPVPLNHIEKGTLWQNWGTTLSSKPHRIYSDGAIFPGENKARYPSPRTLEDVKTIVAYAREKNLSVRVFGSNHSWAPLSQTSGVLVDNRQINTTGVSAGFDPLGNGKEWPNYAMTLVKADPDADGKPTVQFPPGISTGDLERWIQVNGGYRMPTSTVEDVFTMGGILTTACHGTGKNNPNISDWVVAMEFIDFEGNLQRISKKSVPAQYLREVCLKDGDAGSKVTLAVEDVYRAMLCNLGAFGVIWSYTMRIYEPAPVYLVAKLMPWKELFDDTAEAREKFAQLQAKHATFEVFYFPFRLSLLGYEKNPDVYVWLGDNAPPTDGTPVYEPTEAECFGQDLIQHMGVSMLHGAFKSACAEPALYATMPYLASMMFLNLLLTKTKDGSQVAAWKLPQWRSSHPFNAIGSVEGVRCCDIEWTMQMNTKQGGAGFLHANRSYGDIIRAIHAAHDSSINPFDMHRFPVTIAAEMRIFHGSGALMAPQYWEHYDVDDTSDGRAYVAPEIVSHAGNAGWDRFYASLNAQMIDPKNADRYGLAVRCHQAKEFSVLPRMLEFLRKSYRAEKYKKADPLTYFAKIRDVIDPSRTFLNPYLHQFLYTDAAQYTPPEGTRIFTRGQQQDLDPHHLKA